MVPAINLTGTSSCSPEAIHEGLPVQVLADEHDLVDARLIIRPGLVTGAIADGLVHTLEHKLAVAVALQRVNADMPSFK